MKQTPSTDHCGHCNRVVIRRDYAHMVEDRPAGAPVVYSRTLVGPGEFLASCSPACWEQLHNRALRRRAFP